MIYAIVFDSNSVALGVLRSKRGLNTVDQELSVVFIKLFFDHCKPPFLFSIIDVAKFISSSSAAGYCPYRILIAQPITSICVICIYKNLWGVVVLGLVSHPDHNKGPNYAPLILAILQSRQPTISLHNLGLEVLNVHYYELRLFGAKAFPPTCSINIAHLTQQQQVQLLTPLSLTRFGPSMR